MPPSLGYPLEPLVLTLEPVGRRGGRGEDLGVWVGVGHFPLGTRRLDNENPAVLYVQGLSAVAPAAIGPFAAALS